MSRKTINKSNDSKDKGKVRDLISKYFWKAVILFGVLVLIIWPLTRGI